MLTRNQMNHKQEDIQRAFRLLTLCGISRVEFDNHERWRDFVDLFTSTTPTRSGLRIDGVEVAWSGCPEEEEPPEPAEPCCDCGEDYPRSDLHDKGEILCPACRRKPNRLDGRPTET